MQAINSFIYMYVLDKQWEKQQQPMVKKSECSKAMWLVWTT